MLRNSKDRLDVINCHHIELILNKLPGFRCLKLVGLQSSPAILLIRNWMVVRSKSTGKPYFWNVKLGISQSPNSTLQLWTIMHFRKFWEYDLASWEKSDYGH